MAQKVLDMTNKDQSEGILSYYYCLLFLHDILLQLIEKEKMQSTLLLCSFLSYLFSRPWCGKTPVLRAIHKKKLAALEILT